MQCPLCENQSDLKYSNHPSYIENSYFDIYNCNNCNTSFVYPLTIDTELYNQIYKNPTQVPGYKRYYQITENIITEKSPLKYLKKHSLEYKFIIGEIAKSYKQNNKILEVGCGMGYLTYALNSEGYTTTGTDIANNVIDFALEKFGNFYIKGGIDSVVNNKYDIIILTEVIEHVPEPIMLLEKLISMLNINGVILLTTPNKSAYMRNALWVTDAPPIHLWWFSEESMKRISNLLLIRYRIIHPKVKYENAYHYINKNKDIEMPLFIPNLNNKYLEEIESNVNMSLKIYKFIMSYIPFRSKLIKIRNVFMKNYKTEIPYTMCVKLFK